MFSSQYTSDSSHASTLIPHHDVLENDHVNVSLERYLEFENCCNYIKQCYSCSDLDLVAGDKKLGRKLYASLVLRYRTEAMNNHDKFVIPQERVTLSAYNWIVPSSQSSCLNEYIAFGMISRSIYHFIHTHFGVYLDQLREIEREKTKFQDMIGEQFRIFIFGSVSVLLHDSNNTDVDFYVMYYKKSVPVITVLLPTKIIDCCESMDLSGSTRGLRKKHLLRKYLKQKPCLFVILNILVQWFRRVFSPNVIKTYLFVWKMIDYCIERGYLNKEIVPSEEETFEIEIAEKDSHTSLSSLKELTP